MEIPHRDSEKKVMFLAYSPHVLHMTYTRNTITSEANAQLTMSNASTSVFNKSWRLAATSPHMAHKNKRLNKNTREYNQRVLVCAPHLASFQGALPASLSMKNTINMNKQEYLVLGDGGEASPASAGARETFISFYYANHTSIS